MESEPKVVFSGSNFNENYTLLQFHFHWGENDYQGSEHFIDGFKFPAEVSVQSQRCHAFWTCLNGLL